MRLPCAVDTPGISAYCPFFGTDSNSTSALILATWGADSTSTWGKSAFLESERGGFDEDFGAASSMPGRMGSASFLRFASASRSSSAFFSAATRAASSCSAPSRLKGMSFSGNRLPSLRGASGFAGAGFLASSNFLRLPSRYASTAALSASPGMKNVPPVATSVHTC